jgi:hypothetical protein
MKLALWIVQGLLALAFLGLGAMKLVTPIDEMAAQLDLPIAFLRFVGLAELLGAVGLTLPALVGIRTGLVPLAAAGLAVVTSSAAGYHLMRGDGLTAAAFPGVLALLSLFVAYGRWRLVPHGRPATERETARI